MHKLNWDDLRIFLAVARSGRIITAARKLALDHTTVARRVSALEEGIGSQLIFRSPRGVKLTKAGETLLDYAERMETEALAVTDRLSGSNTEIVGTVRLATPEGFGSYLVASHIGKFVEQHPNISIELVPETRSFSLSKREADIAISLKCPTEGRVIAQKLSDYRVGLYASRDYLKRVDAINTVSDLQHHPFVWYIEDLIDLPELRFLDEIVSEARVVFRSSSITAQHNAIAAGLGLGILHRFAAMNDPRLVMLLPDVVAVSRTYWITLHADNQHVPRIRAVMSFLHQLAAEHLRAS